MRRSPLVLLAACFLFASTGSATPINLGILSFDNYIPDGDTPGVNVFDIGLYVGATYSLGSDFPDLNETTLLNAELTLDGSNGTQVFDLGDISPGVFTPPDSLYFSTTVTFTDATLTATLDNPVLQLSDGTTFTAADDSISATILPSSGENLQPGTDLTVITTSDAASTPAPEPATIGLFGGAAFLLIGFYRKIGKRDCLTKA